MASVRHGVRVLLSILFCIVAQVRLADAAHASASETIEPAQIAVGETARLTISTSGGDSPASIPAIPGLEIEAVGTSSEIRSINGRSSSSASTIYQVTPQQAGIFTIPALLPGVQPVVLQVSANGHHSRAGSGTQGPSSIANNPSIAAIDAAHASPDGSAFVRLRAPKHDLYVGESIPVEIQVGLRAGLVASINGLPTLNGDAFTLDPLGSKPDQTEVMIDDRPFTLLTWHSVLAAVKPGALSLAIATPLTVRMRAANTDPADLFHDPALSGVFDDPFFQGFFGGTTERDITVTNAPAAFTVVPLPAKDRPANFSGAVGHFTVSDDLSAAGANLGDPLTLTLHVQGAGNFDRVASTMLKTSEDWKTYQPAAKFSPSDGIGYRGEKSFEQPLIASRPGRQIIPALEFSYFNPTTRQYETARTASLSVDIAPALANRGGATNTNPTAQPAAGEQSKKARPGLRPDHVETSTTTDTLRPPFFQPRDWGIPSALMSAFLGAAFWLRRRKTPLGASDNRRSDLQTGQQQLLQQMNAAAACGDAQRFFHSARAALRQDLARRWHVAPEQVTLAELEARLGSKQDVYRRTFAMADEATYAKDGIGLVRFEQWKQLILRQLAEDDPS